jgi:predicted transposase/invertase (TIGR01784 family)
MKFADPKNDVAFKKIFGDEKHKEVLISFLNSVLDFKDEKTIVDVTLSNTYQLSEIEDLKDTILDIKAKNQNGEEFIVEMQKKDIGDFAKRSLYYTSKAYVSQIDVAEKYLQLKKVYYIAIVDFEIFDNKNFISRHLIINQETTKQDLKDFEFTFIELPKFNLELKDCDTIVKKWIYFINNASSLDLIPKELENIKEFQVAFQTANTYAWNKKELSYYDRVSLRRGDDKNALMVAKKRAEEKGMRIGIKKGMQKGRQEGMQKGIEKGILTVAQNSIKQGLDNQTISLITGLDAEQIEQLRKDVL